MSEDRLIRDFVAAVDRNPDAVELRLHLAELLLAGGRYTEALSHCGTVLSQDAAMAAPSGDNTAFDWSAAEEQVADIIQPAFVDDGEGALDVQNERDHDVLAPSDVKLADVAGMDDVKARLEVSLLGPIRNPELMRAYKISARGGLLLYGPPGSGKTFFAKAVSGELDANFYPIGISDVLQHFLGDSERAVHEIFEVARRNSPCVLFFDEVDALGMRRTNMRGDSGHRTVTNALLAETDPATSDNTGVYVMGATNAPSDVDPALRRPGRFDRVVFVGLPDGEARAAIVRFHLRDRPVAGIDLKSIAACTDGFSGADLAHICDTATQLAMADWMRSRQVRPISMRVINAAMEQVRPSAGEWFDIARNVVEFGNRDGTYDDLAKPATRWPSHPTTRIRCGLIVFDLRRRREGLALARKALDAAPHDYATHYEYARLLATAGDATAALPVATEALPLGPASADAHDLMGVIYGMLGRRAESTAEHEEALRLQPSHARALANIAVNRANSRNLAGALSGFSQAGQLDPHLGDEIRNNITATVRQWRGWTTLAAWAALFLVVRIEERAVVGRRCGAGRRGPGRRRDARHVRAVGAQPAAPPVGTGAAPTRVPVAEDLSRAWRLGARRAGRLRAGRPPLDNWVLAGALR